MEPVLQALFPHRIAAERELNKMGGALMIAALILMEDAIKMAANPPAWVMTDAGEMGEQHNRALLFYYDCTMVSFALSAGVVVLLCLYKLKVAGPFPTLFTVRVSMVAVLVSTAMASCMGSSEDWLGAAARFLFMAAGAVPVLLFMLRH